MRLKRHLELRGNLATAEKERTLPGGRKQNSPHTHALHIPAAGCGFLGPQRILAGNLVTERGAKKLPQFQ